MNQGSNPGPLTPTTACKVTETILLLFNAANIIFSVKSLKILGSCSANFKFSKHEVIFSKAMLMCGNLPNFQVQ